MFFLMFVKDFFEKGQKIFALLKIFLPLIPQHFDLTLFIST